MRITFEGTNCPMILQRLPDGRWQFDALILTQECVPLDDLVAAYQRRPAAVAAAEADALGEALETLRLCVSCLDTAIEEGRAIPADHEVAANARAILARVQEGGGA